MNRPVRDQRGSGTVLALLVLALVLLATAISAGLGAMVLAHRRAQTAADLAALAGAAVTGPGGAEFGGRACPRAESIARANGADLIGCEERSGVVGVTVAVGLPLRLPGTGDHVLARARAGPG